MKKIFKASMLALPMFIVAGTAYSQTATVKDTGSNDVVVYTKDAADTIFAEKQAWLDKQLGYDTATKNATDVLNGNTISDAINANTTGISEINAALVNIYTKTETDGAISTALGNYTTTSDLTTLLNAKADASALDAKANATDLSALTTLVGSGTMTAGSTVVEAVNKNTADITTNAGKITTLEGKVTTNETNITTNAGKITTLEGKVATNETAIATNTSNIATNTGKITTLEGKVTTNTGDIATNAGKIATNTQNIATNTQNIATNTQNITTNTQNIAKNAQNITALDTKIGDLGDLTGDVSGATSVVEALNGKQDTLTAGDITTDLIASEAVTTEKLGADAVTNEKLADNAVKTENIANGTIVFEDLNSALLSADAVTNGTGSEEVLATTASVGKTIGSFADLQTDNKNMTNGTTTAPTTVVEALNNIDSTLGVIHGLSTSLGDDYKGNLAEGTTVSEHLTAIDTAIGNRDEYANDKGSNGYTATGGADVVTALSEIASNIGTASDLTTAGKNGVATSNTVNANIDAVNAAIGDVSTLSDGNYVASATNLTDAVKTLDSNMYRLDNKINKLHNEFEGGMASAAALSALVPNARANGNTQVSLGAGEYGGHTAMAFGGFHWVNDNILLNAGAAWTDNSTMTYRMGVTYSW